MRTLLRVTVDVTAANKAFSEGTLQSTIKATMDRLKPEAAYFLTIDGNRSCLMVFDLQDPAEMPVIAEPLFSVLSAKVEFSPVMNAEELQRALQNMRKSEFVLEQ
jgi:tRNA/tmRNA/rRNA uracil-C5-methylase (TrmA/RlmC/RlmD family)